MNRHAVSTANRRRKIYIILHTERSAAEDGGGIQVCTIASGKSTFGKWSRKILRLSPASVLRQRFEPNPIRLNGAGHGVNFCTRAAARRTFAVHNRRVAFLSV